LGDFQIQTALWQEAVVTKQLVVELASDAASIPRARQVARRFAEGCGADPDSLALAASEAVTNAVIHGYRDGRAGPIELRGYRDGDDCVLEVADRGVGMRPHPESPGLGMGLPVITAVAGSVEIESLRGGTAIRMRFPRV
jgi:serine/threonine-protein kinase RsbW/stage II sporulation protein AB (anti-sigma F factor)